MGNSKVLLLMLLAAAFFSSIAADMEPAQSPASLAYSPAGATTDAGGEDAGATTAAGGENAGATTAAGGEDAGTTTAAGGEDAGAEQGGEASSALPPSIAGGEFNEYGSHGADKVLIINHVENKNDVAVECKAGKRSSGGRKHYDALPGESAAGGEASGDDKSGGNASVIPSRGVMEEKDEGYGDDGRKSVKLINEIKNRNKVTVKCEADAKSSHKKPYEEEKEEEEP